MMATTHFIIFSALLAVCYSQRSPYAGRDPIGYPKIEVTTTSTTTVRNQNALGNKFGENQTTTTTQRLPLEALGDRELVNRLGQLPQDKQPFWFLNWQELEKHRTRPHTFDQKPNIFNSPVVSQQQNAINNQVVPQQQNAFNNQIVQQQQNNLDNQVVPQQQIVQRPQNTFNNQVVPQQQNAFNNQVVQRRQNAFNNQRVPQQNFGPNRF